MVVDVGENPVDHALKKDNWLKMIRKIIATYPDTVYKPISVCSIPNQLMHRSLIFPLNAKKRLVP